MNSRDPTFTSVRFLAGPPFIIAQLVVLAAFVALGILAPRAFHPRAMAD